MSESCAADAADAAAPRYLLVAPCEPSECHIYYSQQRKSLPHALALAAHTGRTLVLPPFEHYRNQAQTLTNAFRATDDGRTPLFTRWSELFDFARLRQHADVIELHEMPRDEGGAWSFGRAILSKGLGAPSETVAKRGTTKGDLAGIFGEGACHSTGLFSNLSKFGGQHAYDGALYGGAVRLGELRCGGLAFSRPSTWTGRPIAPATAAAAVGAWLGDAPAGALFGVGHALHTHAAAAEHMQLAERAVRPHPRLLSEARRFVRAALDPSFAAADDAEGYGVRGRYVAIHWRHGDYVDYNLVATADRVVRAATGALDELGCAECAVFLMTNHPNATAVDELRARLPMLVRYGGGEEEAFEGEGERLVVESAIATHAEIFFGPGRSAVSQLIEAARRAARPGAPAAPRLL